MDATEASAERYLRKSYTDVVFQENDPPDFVVNGTIAVEVRRLNQHVETPSGPVGLESDQFAMNRLLGKVASEIPARGIAENWFILGDFGRPLPKWKEIEKAVRKKLTEFRDSETRSEGRINVLANVQLDLLRATYKPGSPFLRAGGYMDGDTGGWVVAELIRNMHICIEEKSSKIQEVRQRFPVWWLLLVDHMDLGITPSDAALPEGAIRKPKEWDKVIVVNREGSLLLLEI